MLLRTGVKGKDAVSLARELLVKHGGLRGLLSQESKALKGEKGLGQAKAATLIASTEIVRRSLRQVVKPVLWAGRPRSKMGRGS